MYWGDEDLLSKQGFQFHLDNIENQAKWVEYYNGEPEMSKVPQDSIDRSKKILLKHFEETEKK